MSYGPNLFSISGKTEAVIQANARIAGLEVTITAMTSAAARADTRIATLSLDLETARASLKQTVENGEKMLALQSKVLELSQACSFSLYSAVKAVIT